MEPKIRQIIEANDAITDKIAGWMFKWWGEAEGFRYEAIRCYVEHGFQKKRLPQTYGLFLDDELIGVYQFMQEDLFVRPDLYPWLANVYIDEVHRGKGYGKILMESIRENAARSLEYDEVYLFTKHIGLYEKFGWEFVKEIDTHMEMEGIARLYKLPLR